MGMFEILLRVAKPPTYGVHYTSTDGQTVTPHDVSAFGLSVLLDNTYSGGVGTFVLDSRATMIYTDAFSGCSRLLSIDLDGITTIGARAFRFTAITEIELPSTLTSIGEEAFYYAGNLTDVTVLAETPPTLGTNAFASTVQHIYVPADKVNVYKNTVGWSYFSDKILPIGYAPAGNIDITVLCHILSNNTMSGDGYGIQNSTPDNDRAHGFVARNEMTALHGTPSPWGTGTIWASGEHNQGLEEIYSLVQIPVGATALWYSINANYDFAMFVRDPAESGNVDVFNSGWKTLHEGTITLPSAITDGSKTYWMILNTRSNGEYSSKEVGQNVSNDVQLKIKFIY